VPYEKLRNDLIDYEPYAWLPDIRGAYRLSSILRAIKRPFARKAYDADIVLLPLPAPSSEYHRCIQAIPGHFKIGICGNQTNQSKDVDATSRDWYSAQMDVSSFPWDFPETKTTQLFLKFLGIEASEEKLLPEFWTTEKDCQKAEAWLKPVSGQVTLGIAPGVSSVAAKQLPPQWYLEALKPLDHRSLRIVFLGSKEDVSICERTAAAIKDAWNGLETLNLAGKTGVLEAIECVRRCDLVVSQETATLHIATALGKPTLGIVGGGHYGRFYPWGNPALSKVANKQMDCYGCNWHCKYETIRCIQEIQPSEAGQTLQALLSDLLKKR